MGNSTRPYGHFAGVVGANQIRVPVVATTVCYNVSGTRLIATIVFDRPGDAKATPTVYDIDGRRVATANMCIYPPGPPTALKKRAVLS